MAKANKPETNNIPAASSDDKRLRQSAAPECGYCGERMVAKRTEAVFTRYYCENAQCPCEAKPNTVKLPRPKAQRVFEDPSESSFSAR